MPHDVYLQHSFGKDHEYLGLKMIWITDDKKLIIDMSDQEQDILNGFSKEIYEFVTSLATTKLMNADD